MTTNGVLYGVIIDLRNRHLSIQTDTGETKEILVPEDLDTSNLLDGLTTGSSIRIEYDGKLGASNKKDFKISRILPSDKEMNLSKEAGAVAGEIILAFKNKDQSSLARLCEYPLIIERGTTKEIKSVQEFISLPRDEIFTTRLVEEIKTTNMFTINTYNDGFILGVSKPNVVVQNTKDGFLITGFHYGGNR